MESQIKTFTYPNGDIQRVQAVRLDSWAELDFLDFSGSDRTLGRFSGIYRDFLVPSAPWLFGNMIMFRLPKDLETDFPFETNAFGHVAHRLTAAATALKTGVRIRKGKPVFKNQQVRAFWQELERRDCVKIISGKLPVTTIIPLGEAPGYMTESETSAALKVNASFFIMDRFDCATVYDHVGTPFGLTVKDGFVSRPPLYGREALLVRDNGAVEIRPMDVRMLTLRISDQVLVSGENCRIFTRPHHARSPMGTAQALVIVGNRVEAVGKGSLPVPASGFVLCPDSPVKATPGDQVTYCGLEDVCFGIQVGNSILKDGIPTEKFLSSFYNIKKCVPIPFPPSLYPMDFDHARAARIALGADKDGRPMILWAEGAAKFGYVPGKGSCGASLKEMCHLCADMGMVNAVNLDGGGSAQILLRNQRSLEISDRNREDFSQAERPIPLGLIVR